MSYGETWDQLNRDRETPAEAIERINKPRNYRDENTDSRDYMKHEILIAGTPPTTPEPPQEGAHGQTGASSQGSCPYPPEYDATDGACPAWWRGGDYAGKQWSETMERAIRDVRREQMEADCRACCSLCREESEPPYFHDISKDWYHRRRHGAHICYSGKIRSAWAKAEAEREN